MSTEGRVEIIALAGMPEVAAGDDLAAMIGDALEATDGALPLEPGDVLVVTQKIVSKAEGATVDLRTVTPSADAIAWAEAWDRDPRQIQVVLDQAVRVVRRAHGVLIVETHHGFVCANAGVDASNVGPESGDLVTLLPRDPDASGDRVREAIRARFGTDLAVIVSDSFGRPWRWGITDVAIGVSGMLPLDDLRGTPDADGRVMESTVRGVADEIASAAELALGKMAGRPVALVRGARPPDGRRIRRRTSSSPPRTTCSGEACGPRQRRTTSLRVSGIITPWNARRSRWSRNRRIACAAWRRTAASPWRT